ncbi:MAG: glutamine-hydrolyzing carbamoyl-phosphate synthase small subunit, partial [Alistipes sp.]|nr:glutamine-hydrolyzing carbamoyl-phosphate synthase small subunit [Alistipes sp.]
MESDKIHVRALIVGSYSDNYSHWNAAESLSDWLCRERIPAVTGIDTRALTKVLREQGVMMGELIFDDGSAERVTTSGEEGLQAKTVRDNSEYESVNWVDQVSCKEIIRYNEGADKRIVLLDCGVKHNIIRNLLKRGVEVIRVPWDYDFNNLQFDGLFLSNGPGDPNTCDAAVQHIRTFLGSQHVRPLMGICMGNQLLAKAAGGSVYKLPYGHRSHNQPVRMEGTNRCFITSQNHGYAVDPKTLPAEWRPYFTNMNDNSNEGIRHLSRPWFSAQFHPEAASGPTDTEFLFDDFASLL